MGLVASLDDTSNATAAAPSLEMSLTFDDLDDAELDTYIMSEHEFQCKKGLWHKRNADYLEAQKCKILKKLLFCKCIIFYYQFVRKYYFKN